MVDNTELERIADQLQRAYARLYHSIQMDGPNIYTILHGVAQHHTYHAGRIMLLKRAY